MRPEKRCKKVEIIGENAARYEIPSDVTVIFFFSPFSREILAQVLENIRRSLAAHPRKVEK
jgi:hypothetical protein